MNLNLFSWVKKFLSSEKDSALQMSAGNPKNKASKDFIDSKNQSMKDSQGVSDFSGSGYHGPGNVDAEKRNSNMSQRNF